jgi:hypothetical protein
MSAWRRKAIEFLPDYRERLNDREYTVWQLFFDLVPEARKAHDEFDVERLRAIYGFGEWCLAQKSDRIRQPAALGFYEHLFDASKRLWPRVVAWLSPAAIDLCWRLWEERLDSDSLKEIKKMIEQKNRRAK